MFISNLLENLLKYLGIMKMPKRVLSLIICLEEYALTKKYSATPSMIFCRNMLYIGSIKGSVSEKIIDWSEFNSQKIGMNNGRRKAPVHSQVLFSMICKNLDGRRIHHIRFLPEGGAQGAFPARQTSYTTKIACF